MDVVNPLSIILVKSDSKGDRLLFRYPYNLDKRSESSQQTRRRNPYSMAVHEDILQSPPPQVSNVYKGWCHIYIPWGVTLRYLFVMLLFI